jgi:hypothetical protein
MALRDKLAARSQPLLPGGTQIRQVFLCQTGPNPLLFILTYLIYFWIQFRIVCVTDDAIYVLRSSKVRNAPKEVIARLPRQQQLGPVSGLWAKIDIGGERHWVNKRFHSDIEAADRGLSGAPPVGQARY